MRCYLSEWQSPSSSPSQAELLLLSMSRTFASIIDILRRVLNGPNVFPLLRRWAHSQKHTNWKRSFCKWFVIGIPGWQNTLKIPRPVYIRAEWVHLCSWTRKHSLIKSSSFFFRIGKNEFFCSQSSEGPYCTEGFFRIHSGLVYPDGRAFSKDIWYIDEKQCFII